MARGIDNNNPGNIKKNDIVWQGQANAQPDPTFVTFKSAYFGIRALARILYNYQHLHGLTTIYQIISRWAPSIENNVEAYINDVANRCGIDPNAEINLANDNTLCALVTAVIWHENGEQPYTDVAISNAVHDAIF